MIRGLIALPALALSACVTPPAPDPSVNLRGTWRVTAVNGQPTPRGSDAYYLKYTPPTGSARFGCNGGSGDARVDNGWFIAGQWIITVAGCPTVDMQFERNGFDILIDPAAIEVKGRHVRLRNKRGSIDLVRP